MAQTEDGAGVISQSYVTPRCSVYSFITDHADMIIAFVSAITWSSCETLYEMVTYLITFDGLTSNCFSQFDYVLFVIYL